MAVAADAQGATAVEPWVAQAGAAFPVVIDASNRLGATLGYTVVPTGIFVDESGAVCHLQDGDFTVSDESVVALVTRFLAGEDDVLPGMHVESGRRLSPLEQELVDSRIHLASELLANGKNEEALLSLDRALELDPENYVIRKQRWNIRHPDRFHPEIDWEWQKEQLARELETERQAANEQCGPDGCPIPPSGT